MLNSHILTCQRLIKQIPVGAAQNDMYKSVLREVVGLLGAEQKQSVILEEEGKGDSSRTWKKQTRKKKQAARNDDASDDAQGVKADRIV